MTGTNLRPPHSHGGHPPLVCSLGLHAAAAVALSSVVARCESPPRVVAWGVEEEGEEGDLVGDDEGGDGGGGSRRVNSLRVAGGAGGAGAGAGVGAGAGTGPASRQGSAPLTVSHAGDAAAPTGLTLEFASRPRVGVTAPVTAAADHGGTVVAVHGHDLREGSGWARCAFGTILVAAAIQNGTRVECIAPSHVEADVPFAVTLDAQRLLGSQAHLEFSFV